MADTPYVVDLPAMTGDVAQTLAQLRKTRLEIVQAGPKPNYSVHGEAYSWQGLMDYFDRSIRACQKELVELQPWETITAAR